MFSSWQDETEEDWRRNGEKLEGMEIVEPMLSCEDLLLHNKQLSRHGQFFEPVIELGEVDLGGKWDANEMRCALEGLARHERGDWGNVSSKQWVCNLQARECGGLLVSEYVGDPAVFVWTDQGIGVTRVRRASGDELGDRLEQKL